MYVCIHTCVRWQVYDVYNHKKIRQFAKAYNTFLFRTLRNQTKSNIGFIS